jgi:hypothetical protein
MPERTFSMPAEPLNPSKDLMLNSGGFFMPKSLGGCETDP